MPDLLVDPKTVVHVANLANLTIDPTKVDSLARELSHVLNLVENMNQINTESVEETIGASMLSNVTRQDLVDYDRTLTQEQALSQARSTHKGYFVVDATIDKTNL